MKLPRDLSGAEVARRLARHYGYHGIVTCGSGTLDAIIADVAAFLDLPKQAVTGHPLRLM